MNYVKQMNGFLERIQYYEISPQAQALYLQLFRLFNKANWPKELSPSANKLRGLAGLNGSAFARARQELIDNGYIIAICTADKKGYTYQLIDFAYNDEVEKTENNEKSVPLNPPKNNNGDDVNNIPDIPPNFDNVNLGNISLKDMSDDDIKSLINNSDVDLKCNLISNTTSKREVNDADIINNPNNINNNIYIKNKTREKPKERSKELNTAKETSNIRRNNYLSQDIISKIDLFKKSYPDKVSDNYSDYLPYSDLLARIDINELITQVRNSNFLASCKNLKFSWLLDNHLRVLNGYYVNFAKPSSNYSTATNITSTQRTYTKEELDRLIDDISQVEF